MEFEYKNIQGAGRTGEVVLNISFRKKTPFPGEKNNLNNYLFFKKQISFKV